MHTFMWAVEVCVCRMNIHDEKNANKSKAQKFIFSVDNCRSSNVHLIISLVQSFWQIH